MWRNVMSLILFCSSSIFCLVTACLVVQLGFLNICTNPQYCFFPWAPFRWCLILFCCLKILCVKIPTDWMRIITPVHRLFPSTYTPLFSIECIPFTQEESTTLTVYHALPEVVCHLGLEVKWKNKRVCGLCMNTSSIQSGDIQMRFSGATHRRRTHCSPPHAPHTRLVEPLTVHC